MNIKKIKRDVRRTVDDNILSIFAAYAIYILCMILFPFSIILYFVEPGFTFYMTQTVHRKEIYLSDLFFYTNYKWDYLKTGFLKRFKIFLNTLLFIVPGIIKKYSYAMVPFILMDKKHKNCRGKECLKLSEYMMQNHKVDLFLLDFSFIPYHIVAIFTLGLLELYIIPYHQACKYKLLYEIKKSYTGEKQLMESNVTYTPAGKIYKKKSIPLPKSRDKDGNFVPVYCLKCGTRLRKDTVICENCGYEYENDPNAKF